VPTAPDRASAHSLQCACRGCSSICVTRAIAQVKWRMSMVTLWTAAVVVAVSAFGVDLSGTKVRSRNGMCCARRRAPASGAQRFVSAPASATGGGSGGCCDASVCGFGSRREWWLANPKRCRMLGGRAPPRTVSPAKPYRRSGGPYTCTPCPPWFHVIMFFLDARAVHCAILAGGDRRLPSCCCGRRERIHAGAFRGRGGGGRVHRGVSLRLSGRPTARTSLDHQPPQLSGGECRGGWA
jgi:hypothetical protein